MWTPRQWYQSCLTSVLLLRPISSIPLVGTAKIDLDLLCLCHQRSYPISVGSSAHFDHFCVSTTRDVCGNLLHRSLSEVRSCILAEFDVYSSLRYNFHRNSNSTRLIRAAGVARDAKKPNYSFLVTR